MLIIVSIFIRKLVCEYIHNYKSDIKYTFKSFIGICILINISYNFNNLIYILVIIILLIIFIKNVDKEGKNE